MFLEFDCLLLNGRDYHFKDLSAPFHNALLLIMKEFVIKCIYRIGSVNERQFCQMNSV